MTTIEDIEQGKSGGNYFKLIDFGEDSFQVTESIDPKTTQIRVEKANNPEGSKKAETEYFHIGGVMRGEAKDLSVTFFVLKQLAAVMPKENWKGYSIKYLGQKGSGKNAKHSFQVLGKSEIRQERLTDVVDNRGKIIAELKKADAYEDGAFWDMATKQAGSIGEAMGAIEKLKAEGKIVNLGGKWRAT